MYRRSNQKSASQKSGKNLIVDRRDVLTLRCTECHLPFLEIADGELSIQSKHGANKHQNSLSIEQVKKLLLEMVRQQRPRPKPETW